MLQLALLVTLTCATLAHTKSNFSIPQLDGRIVGGNNVKIEDHPHQISLRYLLAHVCGGIIIAPKYVVTAAHCTDGALARQLSIRAGSSLVNSGGVIVRISTIYQNPNYNRFTYDYDISILLLNETLRFSDTIRATALPSSGETVAVNSTAFVTGWGITSESGTTPSGILQGVSLLVVSREVCRNIYGANSITDRMICAYYSGRDACQGDSGGPLRVEGHTVGIVSWGTGCARAGLPGVYTNVAAIRRFISEIASV